MTLRKKPIRWPLGCRFVDYRNRKFTIRKIVFGNAVEGYCNEISIDEGIILFNSGDDPQTEVGFIQDGTEEMKTISVDDLEELYRSKNIDYLPYGT
ncbi:hypothetical protein [Sphingobacterium thalpophilum]|uniref:hypothetical protein n=1 Tax=Sphingobacterium thalpophilum TaxID=259 RepID=UPI0024A63E3B|nr:hypothetical protein [Sphingobacterium thalpophilum]